MFTCGAPITLKAFKINVLAATLFIWGFYIFITGSKISIAIISEKTKNFIILVGMRKRPINYSKTGLNLKILQVKQQRQ